MPRQRLSRSLRKFLRRRKAEIRKEFPVAEAKPKITELVERVFLEYSKGRGGGSLRAGGAAGPYR